MIKEIENFIFTHWFISWYICGIVLTFIYMIWHKHIEVKPYEKSIRIRDIFFMFFIGLAGPVMFIFLVILAGDAFSDSIEKFAKSEKRKRMASQIEKFWNKKIV